MANWKDLPSPSRKRMTTYPTWQEIIASEPPRPLPRVSDESKPKPVSIPKPVRAPKAVKPPKPAKKPYVVKQPVVKEHIAVAAPVPALPPKMVDVVEGIYQPVFIYCADCGQLMLWYVDSWQCYCGRTVGNFTSERIVKRRLAR